MAVAAAAATKTSSSKKRTRTSEAKRRVVKAKNAAEVVVGAQLNVSPDSYDNVLYSFYDPDSDNDNYAGPFQELELETSFPSLARDKFLNIVEKMSDKSLPFAVISHSFDPIRLPLNYGRLKTPVSPWPSLGRGAFGQVVEYSPGIALKIQIIGRKNVERIQNNLSVLIGFASMEELPKSRNRLLKELWIMINGRRLFGESVLPLYGFQVVWNENKKWDLRLFMPVVLGKLGDWSNFATGAVRDSKLRESPAFQHSAATATEMMHIARDYLTFAERAIKNNWSHNDLHRGNISFQRYNPVTGERARGVILDFGVSIKAEWADSYWDLSAIGSNLKYKQDLLDLMLEINGFDSFHLFFGLYNGFDFIKTKLKEKVTGEELNMILKAAGTSQAMDIYYAMLVMFPDVFARHMDPKEEKTNWRFPARMLPMSWVRIIWQHRDKFEKKAVTIESLAKEYDMFNVNSFVVEQIKELMTKHGFRERDSGLTVVHLRRKDVDISVGFGSQLKENKAGVSVELGFKSWRNMRFRVFSLSKIVTAVAILLLEEDGKIKLSDTLDKFEALKLVPSASQVTVEQLLNHTSGLPDPITSVFMMRTPPNIFQRVAGLTTVLTKRTETLSIKEQVDEMARMAKGGEAAPGAAGAPSPPQAPPAPPPGASGALPPASGGPQAAKFVYNNSGYDLLAHMISASLDGKESAEDYIRRRIFVPLGMGESGFQSDNSVSEYHPVQDNEGAPGIKEMYGSSGGNSFVSCSLRDYSRFLSSFQILSSDSAAFMEKIKSLYFVDKERNRWGQLGLTHRGEGDFRTSWVSELGAGGDLQSYASVSLSHSFAVRSLDDAGVAIVYDNCFLGSNGSVVCKPDFQLDLTRLAGDVFFG